MKKLLLPLLSVFIITPLAAHAVEEHSAWKNNIELSAVQTSGNTKTLAVNTQGKSVHEGDTLRETLKGSANGSTDNNQTTAESYKASLQVDWKVSELDYVFSRFGFESDRFAGFKRRLSETVGYGRNLIKTDDLLWTLEVGGGMRQIRYTDLSKKNEAILRSATDVKWKINDTATLTQDLSTEGGKSGWASESITGLQHALNSHLASKMYVKVKHNTKVAAGIKKTDIETGIALVVNF
jgi:putative salt-induced outer membrane protein